MRWSFTFNKVAGLRPQACNFIKKETLAQEFSFFIKEINNFLSKDLDSRFKLVEPQLVETVKWKFNYIFAEKFRKKMSNLMNTYILKYVPKDLK